MTIKHAVWRIGEQPAQLQAGHLSSEQLLENMIVQEPRIISSEWMLIGRQEITPYNGRIDLLAIAPDASLVLIELKRGRTPREIIAQALDYASWVEQLTPDRIAEIFERFSGGKSLYKAFQEHFGNELDEESLNQSHQIIIVASELDPSTQRIINYLNARDIAVNAISFQVFKHGEDDLLSRAWLIDPDETQANATVTSYSKGDKEPWNGEFYASYGGRNWEDARKYGFISGGGGNWYSQTLKLLSRGDRVWVNIPKKGYVGVCRVIEPIQSIKDFKVKDESGEIPILDALSNPDNYAIYSNDPERAEYFVRVEWLNTLTEDNAISEVGLFGNQNTVCKPTTQKWRHTVDKLKIHFPHWDQKIN